MHVAFTPAEVERAPMSVVVDVLRATSTIAQALASGYRRVLCCAEGVLAGERKAAAIPGFDLGNSPLEFTEPLGETLVFTTTNGTRAILSAAAAAETVLIGSLLNLDAVAAAARGNGDVEVVCAGLQGRFTIDDAYCAGRIAELIGWERSDAAEAAVRLARSFAPHGGHRLVRTRERARRRASAGAAGRAGGRDRRRLSLRRRSRNLRRSASDHQVPVRVEERRYVRPWVRSAPLQVCPRARSSLPPAAAVDEAAEASDHEGHRHYSYDHSLVLSVRLQAPRVRRSPGGE